jgi:hypothetical protein
VLAETLGIETPSDWLSEYYREARTGFRDMPFVAFKDRGQGQGKGRKHRKTLTNADFYADQSFIWTIE